MILRFVNIFFMLEIIRAFVAMFLFVSTHHSSPCFPMERFSILSFYAKDDLFLWNSGRPFGGIT